MFEKAHNQFNNSPIFKNAGLFSAPSYKPLGSVVGSCVFDCDATVRNSYDGGDFKNIELTPSDGELQSQYDLEGIGAAAPTFTGNINNPDAYFLLDGADKFIGVNTLSTFLDSIHKTTGGSNFTFAMVVYYVSANQIFLTNRLAGAANIGLQIYSLSTNDRLRFIQRGDTANSTEIISTGAISVSAWNFIAVAHDHSNNTTKLWLNSSVGEESSNTFNTTTTTASATKLNVGAYDNDSFFMPNGSRIKSLQAFDKYLSDDEIRLVMQTLNYRYNGLLGGFL